MQENQNKEATARIVELAHVLLKENDPDIKRAAAILMTLAGTLSGPKGGMEVLLELSNKFAEDQLSAIQGR
jgi:hypothetical protein